jgi:hypothetical protein
VPWWIVKRRVVGDSTLSARGSSPEYSENETGDALYDVKTKYRRRNSARKKPGAGRVRRRIHVLTARELPRRLPCAYGCCLCLQAVLSRGGERVRRQAAAVARFLVRRRPSEYVNDYFFTDLCSGLERRYNPATDTASGFATGLSRVVGLEVSKNGGLYYLRAGAIRLEWARSGSPAARCREWLQWAGAISSLGPSLPLRFQRQRGEGAL